MVEASTADRVLLALAGGEPPDGSGESGDGGRSVVGLSEALETGAGTMADRVALLSTLSELEEEGLVESRDDDGATAYALTDRGRARASEVRDRLVDRTIEVRNGHEAEIALGEVGQYLPDPALPRALARLTADDVLYLDEDVEGGFVDRTDELDRLARAFEATRGEGGRAVLVAGEPGIGKTTLVEHFLDDCEEALVLSGLCRTDSADPYRAVREAIEPHLDGSPFDRPGVDLSDADDLEAMRTALFADVADALLGLAAGRPVVLFVDDLHAADEPTLSLLSFLVDRLPSAPVLLVGAYRPDDLSEGDRSATFPADWPGDAPHDRIELDAFDRPDTRGLVEGLVGTRRVPESFVDLVHDHTGGVPLFVSEVVTGLLDRGELDPAHDIYPDDPSSVGLPPGAEDAIDRRLAALDPRARDLVRTAALVGEAFDRRVVAGAVDLPDGDLREYLDVLVDGGPFERVDGDRLRFASGLVREVVADGVPEDERTTRHRRIAAALREVAGEDPERAGAVADHLERAGERRRALDAWFDAAAHAESVYAHGAALEAYERALELARDLDDTGRVFDALEARGEIHALLGDHEAATRTLQYVESEADTPRRRRRAARILADQHNTWDDNERARAAAERGLALSGGDPSTPEDVRLLLAKARAITLQGEMSEGRELFDRAVELAGDLADPSLRARALRERAMAVWRQTPEAVDAEVVEEMETAVDLLRNLDEKRRLADALDDLGQLYNEYGDGERGWELVEEALERQRAVGDRVNAVESLHNLAFERVKEAARGRLDPEEASAAVERAHEEATALGHEGMAVRVEQLEGMLLFQGHNDGDAALRQYEHVLDRVRELDLVRWKQGAHHLLARLALVVADDPDRAREHAERLLELVRETDRPYHVLWGLTTMARIHRGAGDPERAREHVAEALSIAADIDAPLRELGARVESALTHLALDDLAAARAESERIDALLADDSFDPEAAGEWGERRPSLAARGVEPRIARAGGDHPAAAEGFEDALAAATDAGDRTLACEFGLELGRTLRLAGEDDRARTALERARDRAADADFRRFRADCERELDRLDAADEREMGT